MVDQATHFSAAAFLKNQSSSEVWKEIQGLWHLVYIGPTDFLMVDQGSNYTSREFMGNLESSGIFLDEAPLEAPGAIGTVESYHEPLRGTYQKIVLDFGKDTSDHECLRMTVFVVNGTVGPEDLCPILLIFGEITRPGRTSPSISQVDRARSIDSAMYEAKRGQKKRRINFGLKHPGGPMLLRRTVSSFQ